MRTRWRRVRGHPTLDRTWPPPPPPVSVSVTPPTPPQAIINLIPAALCRCPRPPPHTHTSRAENKGVPERRLRTALQKADPGVKRARALNTLYEHFCTTHSSPSRRHNVGFKPPSRNVAFSADFTPQHSRSNLSCVFLRSLTFATVSLVAFLYSDQSRAFKKNE